MADIYFFFCQGHVRSKTGLLCKEKTKPVLLTVVSFFICKKG